MSLFDKMAMPNTFPRFHAGGAMVGSVQVVLDLVWIGYMDLQRVAGKVDYDFTNLAAAIEE
jgi:hypothetical protein